MWGERPTAFITREEVMSIARRPKALQHSSNDSLRSLPGHMLKRAVFKPAASLASNPPGTSTNWGDVT